MREPGTNMDQSGRFSGLALRDDIPPLLISRLLGIWPGSNIEGKAGNRRKSRARYKQKRGYFGCIRDLAISYRTNRSRMQDCRSDVPR